VNIDSNEFIKQCIQEIQKIEVKEPEIRIKKIRVDKIKSNDTEKKFIKEASEKVRITKVFNLIAFIERETNLTKKTILKILQGSNNLKLLFVNPQEYAEKVIEVIKECKKSYEVKDIEYIDLGESYDKELFREEITTYEEYALEVKKSIYDRIIKESKIEEEFARALDGDDRIKLFIKLPDWYIIETPAGNYTPDWAIVVEKSQNEEKKIYFVVETKGTNNINELRPEEKNKIESAKKRFQLVFISDGKFIAPVKNFESFEEEW
jgi:type III restriction enzyme